MMNKGINHFSDSSKKLYAMARPVEEWLNVPGNVHVFWKNAEGFYLRSNDLTMDSIGLKDIIGKTDASIFQDLIISDHVDKELQNAVKGLCQAQSNIYIQDDRNVFDSGEVKKFYNYVLCPHQIITFLSHKCPLFDAHNHIVGTFGLCFYLSQRKLSAFQSYEELKEYIANFENLSQSINQPPKRIVVKNVILSTRETACAYYLAKGFALKQIAARLAISVRTVETHLHNIKNKLDCSYNNELTELLYNRGIF